MTLVYVKNSFEQVSFELDIANKQLFEEFNYVYTKNFTSILDVQNSNNGAKFIIKSPINNGGKS